MTLLPLHCGAVSATMEQWTLAPRVFAYDKFIRNWVSLTTTQRRFRSHFNIDRRGAVPSRNTILRWVNNWQCNEKSHIMTIGPTVRTTKRTDTSWWWFQQDGAKKHTSRASMNVVHNLCPGKVISRLSCEFIVSHLFQSPPAPSGHPVALLTSIIIRF